MTTDIVQPDTHSPSGTPGNTATMAARGVGTSWVNLGGDIRSRQPIAKYDRSSVGLLHRKRIDVERVQPSIRAW
jgi:hypothetical protein